MNATGVEATRGVEHTNYAIDIEREGKRVREEERKRGREEERERGREGGRERERTIFSDTVQYDAIST